MAIGLKTNKEVKQIAVKFAEYIRIKSVYMRDEYNNPLYKLFNDEKLYNTEELYDIYIK